MTTKQQARIARLYQQDLRSSRIVLIPTELAKADDTLRAEWAKQNGHKVDKSTIYLLQDDAAIR